jgi:hypothetical protein
MADNLFIEILEKYSCLKSGIKIQNSLLKYKQKNLNRETVN